MSAQGCLVAPTAEPTVAPAPTPEPTTTTTDHSGSDCGCADSHETALISLGADASNGGLHADLGALGLNVADVSLDHITDLPILDHVLDHVVC